MTRSPGRCSRPASRSRRGGRSRTRCSASRIRGPRPPCGSCSDRTGRYTRAFAARGLGTLKDAAAVPPLIALLDPAAKAGLELTVAAIRALAQLEATDAVAALSRLAGTPAVHPNIRLEAVTALGRMRAADGLATVQDLWTDEWPDLRAAAFRAAAAIDQESFMIVLAGLEPDRHWRVRTALAETLGTLPRGAGDRPPARHAAGRGQARHPGRAALARAAEGERPAHAARAAARRSRLRGACDGGARARDAEARRWRRPPAAGVQDRARRRGVYARATAALEALAAYGAAEATSTLVQALEDKDWAVRVRAAELLAKLDPDAAATRTIAPAPGAPDRALRRSRAHRPGGLAPRLHRDGLRHDRVRAGGARCAADRRATSSSSRARASSMASRCTASRPTSSFRMATRAGTAKAGPGTRFATSSTSGPICAARSGMALEWRDTGGSQFFITHSPQPHLDARYTAFGHVVNGMDVVDRIKPGDVIQRIRIWDGAGWLEPR